MLDEVTGEAAHRADLSLSIAHPAFDLEAGGRFATLQVVGDDGHRQDVDGLGNLLANELVHGLHVELRGQALLDAVDDRQLSRPLVGLCQ